MFKPRIVVIVGLTASGKSAVGIELAKQFNGEVVSCDSRQVYKGLDIGTGKVMMEEMDGVPHHLLDIVDPGENFSVFQFQQLAFQTIDEILSRGKLPILVGGTGLYSRSVVENYDFDKKQMGERKYNVLQIALMPPKEWILPKIHKRLLDRVEEGMIDETKKLLEKGVSSEWLRNLGLEYFWNIEYIDGKITLDEYKRALFIKIGQYAKRQRTWFKKERDTIFLTDDPQTFLLTCQQLVAEAIQGS
ncbi:MAG: tRNA (adenosine(37)-N6)-dimethylallyltransferase MiaA [Firmicutes bacterium]|nr:tRNA (adenosine(37)-N6)-dimethylallyltransferase MiaA [Bacillota bacterium]